MVGNFFGVFCLVFQMMNIPLLSGGGLFYAVDGDNSLFSFANCTVANNSGSGAC